LLIALYERAVSFYASLINVNAYHQPGVEAGKKAAAKVIALQIQAVKVIEDRGTPMLVEQIATEIDSIDDIEVIYRILRHLHANDRLKMSGDIAKPSSLLFSMK